MNELIRTRDGRRYWVRSLRVGDGEAVAAGFGALSPASLRTRFFSPVPRLTSALVADLTAVEPGRRIVLIAMNTTTGAVVGEARAVRLREAPDVADVAVTVVDGAQRGGLGSALLQLLRRAAVNEGVSHLAGHVMVENPAAQALVRSAGGRLVFDEPGVLRFTIPPRSSPVPVPAERVVA